jgi:U4/U6.U5 tri-snRNP-associated protein 1
MFFKKKSCGSFSLFRVSAVPQAAEFLDAQPLAKGKTEKAKKKKEGKAAQQATESGFMTLPAPQLQPMINGDSLAPSGFSSIAPNSNSASPVPSVKPGFSRISSAVDSPSQGGTPGPNDRSKVTIGFGAKRKAGEEAFNQPPQKRR